MNKIDVRLLLAGLLLSASQAFASQASPSWDQLDARQQSVLAPLSSEWNRYAPDNKHKLLDIVQYYDKLDSRQQMRVQSKLKDWAGLSQEQRALARTNWQRYQALPAEQRAATLTRLQQNRATRSQP